MMPIWLQITIALITMMAAVMTPLLNSFVTWWVATPSDNPLKIKQIALMNRTVGSAKKALDVFLFLLPSVALVLGFVDIARAAHSREPVTLGLIIRIALDVGQINFVIVMYVLRATVNLIEKNYRPALERHRVAIQDILEIIKTMNRPLKIEQGAE